MDLYAKSREHEKNNENFLLLMQEYPFIKPFQPSPAKAPWHVQAKLSTKIGYDVWMNFWPHVAKGQLEGESSVLGWEQIRLMIDRAVDSCDDGFSVIE